MGKAAKRKVGRPPGRKAPHRPVVSARVPESVYAELKEAAAAAGRTMGEELVWRAAPANLQALLLSRNWKHVHGAQFGAANWISPDNHGYPQTGFIDPAAAAEPLNKQVAENTIERIIERAVKAALAAGGSK
jgi:hypothetical protein